MLVEQSAVNKPIRNVQQFLRRISYDNDIPKIIPDGIFGAQTQNAVMEFQRLFNLPQSGVIDDETWEKIYSEYKNILKKFSEPSKTSVFPSPHFVIKANDENGIVYVIQAMLKALGGEISTIPDVEISGKYDEGTQKAVLNIQNAAGISETGDVNKETWEFISVLFETFVSKNNINPLQKNGKYIIRHP